MSRIFYVFTHGAVKYNKYLNEVEKICSNIFQISTPYSTIPIKFTISTSLNSNLTSRQSKHLCLAFHAQYTLAILQVFLRKSIQIYISIYIKIIFSDEAQLPFKFRKVYCLMVTDNFDYYIQMNRNFLVSHVHINLLVLNS